MLSNHRLKRHLEHTGHGYLVSSDYREVIETLKGWGLLRNSRAVVAETPLGHRCDIASLPLSIGPDRRHAAGARTRTGD